jgi:polar amino acid transport system substrate-binding protein
MLRTIALTLSGLLAFALASVAPGNATNDDHATALAAVADIEAARAEIVKIEDSQVVGHLAFVHAAQRALNAVAGRDDKLYQAADGDPGDGTGAIGNVDRLLDRRDDSLWTPAMQGAKANLIAVCVNLRDSMHEKEMEDYETDLTEALANLALASGRPSEGGVLGGLTGALANTSLGVPAGASTISGCGLPSRGPAYGVVAGHLAYLALPRRAASPIPQEISVSRVVVNGDAVVLYTRQTEQIAALCRQAHVQRTRAVRQTSPSGGPGTLVALDTTPATTVNPASYTTAQAHAGLAVFAANCQSCHGANLQGVAAPAVAGTEFLTTVKTNKWTLADFRTLVVENMPLNNPGTLTPEQYANVIAFLLASNCYPAGDTPFPQKDSPSFATVKMGPVAGAKPSDPKLGVCAVK